jgi:hypothetical protein
MTDTKIPGEFRINLQRNRVLIRPAHGAGKMLEANAGIVAAVQPRARAPGGDERSPLRQGRLNPLN